MFLLLCSSYSLFCVIWWLFSLLDSRQLCVPFHWLFQYLCCISKNSGSDLIRADDKSPIFLLMLKYYGRHQWLCRPVSHSLKGFSDDLIMYMCNDLVLSSILINTLDQEYSRKSNLLRSTLLAKQNTSTRKNTHSSELLKLIRNLWSISLL